jgi:hypothetical protein
MKNRQHHQTGGNSMTIEDRKLIVETLGEMRELKGEMKEFKEHVIGRVQKLETKEAERGKNNISILSLIIASLSVLVNIVFNLFKHGGR